MAAPSPEAVGLIVGSATVTIAAVLSVLGYFARRFLDQQTRNHQDTLTVKSDVHEIKTALPILGFRISRLEAGAIVGAVVAAAYAWNRRDSGSL